MKQFFILNYFSFLPKAQYSYFFSHIYVIEKISSLLLLFKKITGE